MQLEEKCERLRIYIGESDTWEGKPLYQVIVEEARRSGLAGATAIRGMVGFGAHSRLHTSRILRLSEDLPIQITIVDTPEKLDGFMPFIDRVVREGLVTREPVRVHFYRVDKSEEEGE